jgi:hypothetical protein
MHQAGFSPHHRRGCRAGATILQLTSALYDRTKALISHYGQAWAAGARSTPQRPPGQQDRLRDYGPEEAAGKQPPSCRYHRTFPSTTDRLGAADAAVDSTGAEVPVKGLRAGRIRLMAMPEYTAASGRIDHTTFRELADASVRCSGFWAKLLHADRPT